MVAGGSPGTKSLIIIRSSDSFATGGSMSNRSRLRNPNPQMVIQKVMVIWVEEAGLDGLVQKKRNVLLADDSEAHQLYQAPVSKRKQVQWSTLGIDRESIAKNHAQLGVCL